MLGDRQEVEDAFQATFLVLAVRARAIRRRGSVASWLHGVALRVAAAERSRAARRQRHELARAAMTSSATRMRGSDPMCDHELNVVIQEESPASPRSTGRPFALLPRGPDPRNGRQRLGWPVGSVKSRLAWARERLDRLTRRGAAPTTVFLERSGSSKDAELLSSTAVLLGTCLADATLRGALRARTGKGALSGIVSAEAVALMEGVIKSVMTARLILMGTVALMAGVVTAGAGVMAYSAILQKYPPPAVAPSDDARQTVTQELPRPAAAKPAADQGPLAIQVDVVDSEGHRVSGADVIVGLLNGTSRRGSDSADPAERFDLPRVHPQRRVRALHLPMGHAEWRNAPPSRTSASSRFKS